ncbi:lysophospholipid acyltransferase family protein [Tundrisphaera sp. TA3]|uniref:lysophospholipid acyltransferase family protein n=1 Tax=Tundrisphaera sp. TA3 TaxID=3435775 RepID=UPI003EBAE2CF
MPPPPPLIRAHKSGWPRWAVHRLIVGRTRKGLRQVRVQGLDRVRAAIGDGPGGTLFLANHSSWWDLFLVHVLNESIPVDGYGMMEHFNLARFGFFRRIGAFSVDRTSPASVRASLQYASDLLHGPRAGVWVFPQGKIESNDVRPLAFQPGIRALLRRAGRTRVVPVAFRLEFWQDERPEALVRFGEPTWVDRPDLPDLLPTWERRLTDELDALRADGLTQDPARFTSLFEGKRSISERYATFRDRFRGPTPGAPT